MGKDLAASAAAWALSLVVTSPTWVSPVSLPGLLRSCVPQPFLGLAFYEMMYARQAWLPGSSPLLGAGTTVPCPGPSGTEGDMLVPVGGSRCSEPAGGLRQDPALSVTSAPAFPFWVVKARAVNMHSGRAGGGLDSPGTALPPEGPCVPSTEHRRAPPSSSTATRAPGTRSPSDVAPPGPVPPAPTRQTPARGRVPSSPRLQLRPPSRDLCRTHLARSVPSLLSPRPGRSVDPPDFG